MQISCGVYHKVPEEGAPCKFINTHLPFCSIIRPISTENAGSAAAVAGLAASGLLNVQSTAFFGQMIELADAADDAQRS